ncbi:MAG TPA: HAD family hydrolase [Verrucomicrobiae bacterium]|nr:HAD family hydrolase [Verrucomicrobiae bacterium]
MARQSRTRSKLERLLKAPGWNPGTRAALEQLIRTGAGQGLPVVFDFDNTIVWGDIGEAVLAVLARSGALTPQSLPPALCPPLNVPGRGRVNLETCADILEYYEALLAPTAHGRRDPNPLGNGYVWATEVLAGLSVAEITQAAREAFNASPSGRIRQITVTTSRTSVPAPFFYPEIVELIGTLLDAEFTVWVVSASNVWSVRWMVLQGLNPALQKHGFERSIPPEQVVGISTLLADSAGRLYKDSVLVREDSSYAQLSPERLRSLRATQHLQFPVPVYSGKVGCIFDALGREPYLCVGDSPADHPMLAFSQNRLWIARLEKPESQRATKMLMKRTGRANWLVQGVRTAEDPGFYSEPCRL